MTDPNPRPDANPDSPPHDDERGSIEALDPTAARERGASDVEGAPDPGGNAVGRTDGIIGSQGDTAQ